MSDDWLTPLHLPLSPAQFQQLPRNPAYQYEYFDGVAHLSPRPKYFHAVLELEPLPKFERAADSSVLRPLHAHDWDELARVFTSAFRWLPPLGHLADEARFTAARDCLSCTREGGDGPLIERACYVKVDSEDRPAGAIVVTLLPDGELEEVESYHWPAPPPDDAVARRIGRPHVTWIFVNPLLAGCGVGTALLRAAVQELRRQGYAQLASTFLHGNQSSLLWHWRVGFRLVSYPFSRRRWKEPLSGSS